LGNCKLEKLRRRNKPLILWGGVLKAVSQTPAIKILLVLILVLVFF
jgi:hypothetical protein